jgi:hypothetical protein
MTYYDPDHSEEEDRFITFGLSNLGRLLVGSRRTNPNQQRTSRDAQREKTI